ncbi:HNH endonuclease [Paraburkholderia sp. DHOC27]|uniref:HNH endonuclease n=1 Tax=Paraburkholderia sp. DHOC27 TaxID=2303330 RepID=UPI000E3BA880|nr:HNH endonuclease signature motif containing protein [Paraburkholderia sp. DHOC27]RFU48022.1 HNH endonuclease [Paraburkholderia sp. DHOC27]
MRTTRSRTSGNAHLRLTGRALQSRNLKVKEAACYCCAKCGIATTSGQVDHIKAIDNGGTDDPINLQYLCVDCHKVKTANDLGHKVRRAFGPDGMPLDGSW